MSLTIPNTFVNGTTADADEVNENFTAVSDEVNSIDSDLTDLTDDVSDLTDEVDTIGVWTTPSFAAGNFTATSGTWTVGSGDLSAYAYTIVNKMMTLNVIVHGDSVTTGAPTILHVAIPASKVAAKKTWTVGYGGANVPTGGAFLHIEVNAGETVVNAYLVTHATWPDDADIAVSFSITFEIE